MDTMSFDGSCDPNPRGKMCWSYIITRSDGQVFQQHQRAAPALENTVNVAEYCGLRDGLRAYHAADHRGPLHVTGDSQLIINQVNSTFKVRKAALQPYHAEVLALIHQIGAVTVVWNPRAQNAAADQLARGIAAGDGSPVSDDVYVNHDLRATLTPEVRAAIAALNANPAPGFKDFAALRTGGADAFSKMNAASVQEQAGAQVVGLISAALADPKAQAVALRWVLRGLGVQRAIRKVGVDAEIATRSRR